jgi:hypothetical protein
MEQVLTQESQNPLVTDGGTETDEIVDKYFEDELYGEIGDMFEASMQNQDNNRLATLVGLNHVVGDGLNRGKELVDLIDSLDPEEEDQGFVPENGFDRSNVKRNLGRYDDIDVVGKEYTLNGKGVDLLKFVNEFEEYFVGEQHFEDAFRNKMQDVPEMISEEMGHGDRQASNQVADYLNDLVEIRPIDGNPLGERDYTRNIANKLRSVQGDRLKAFMALADDPDLTYDDISANLDVTSSTVEGWSNDKYGWVNQGLVKEDSKELTDVGEALYNAVESLYDKRAGEQ